MLKLMSLFDGSGGFPLAGIAVGIKPVYASEIEPHPIAVTKQNIKGIVHLGDISKIKGDELEPVDIITFGSPCFPAGTLVLTDRGYITIEDIKIGDKVLTHKGRWRKVTDVGAKWGETVKLKGNHYGLECTANHPLYSLENDNSKSWTKAENMLGKLYAVPHTFEPISIPRPSPRTNGNVKNLPEFNEDLFYLVGHWLGNGWVRDGQRKNHPLGQCYGTIIICVGFKKENLLRTAIEAVENHYHVERGTAAVKYKFSNIFCNWLVDNFGKHSYGKTIPAWVYSMPESWRKALLQGILDSDGYKARDNVFKFTTISKKLAHGIRLLGESLGYSSTIFFSKIKPTCIIEGRICNQHDVYVTELIERKKHEKISDELHSWYKVKKIIPTGEGKLVYNITVDEDNSYIADSVVVHNCQDMSIAGKRAGIKHTDNGDGETTRSGLFMEAIRIIKEMRGTTNGVYPRFAVWENVSGAFNSNRGEDFRLVLEEFVKIKEPDATFPPVPTGGWNYFDVIRGDGWSIAYRLFDAQYWGVPQRRRRIYLVTDFRGECAAEILFARKGMPGHSEKSFSAWKEVTRAFGESTQAASGATGRISGAAVPIHDDQGGGVIRIIKDEKSPTLRAQTKGHPPLIFENHSQDARYTDPLSTVPTISSNFGTGGNNQPFIVEESVPYGICSKDSNSMKSNNPRSDFYEAKAARTLDANGGNPSCNQGGIAVVSVQGSMIGRADKNGPQGSGTNEGVAFTLNATDRHAVAYGIDRAAFNQGQNTKYAPAGAHSGGFNGQDAYNDMWVLDPQDTQYIVRRLTPTECARLQGFPDEWGEIIPKTELTTEELDFWQKVRDTYAVVYDKKQKEYSRESMLKWYNGLATDSAKYKMWGNGIALPNAVYVMQGIVNLVETEKANSEN